MLETGRGESSRPGAIRDIERAQEPPAGSRAPRDETRLVPAIVRSADAFLARAE
jgi:hypothetical protein